MICAANIKALLHGRQCLLPVRCRAAQSEGLKRFAFNMIHLTVFSRLLDFVAIISWYTYHFDNRA